MCDDDDFFCEYLYCLVVHVRRGVRTARRLARGPILCPVTPCFRPAAIKHYYVSHGGALRVHQAQVGRAGSQTTTGESKAQPLMIFKTGPSFLPPRVFLPTTLWSSLAHCCLSHTTAAHKPTARDTYNKTEEADDVLSLWPFSSPPLSLSFSLRCSALRSSGGARCRSCASRRLTVRRCGSCPSLCR